MVAHLNYIDTLMAYICYYAHIVGTVTRQFADKRSRGQSIRGLHLVRLPTNFELISSPNQHVKIILQH